MPNPLNYQADTANLFDARAPFSVNYDPNKPPGDRFKDYVPRDPVKQTTRPDDSVRKKSFMRPPVARYTDDYINGADSAVKRKNERAQIIEIAKGIYAQEKHKRVAFEQAKKVLEETNEGPEAEKAKKILSRTAPMTKEQAMEKAAQQFYGLRS